MTQVPGVTLNNGVVMPQLGFGVFKVPEDETAAAVRTAIETGYRSIDTATLYKNEEGVGEAISAAGVPRDQLFVTTKLWNTDHGYDSALRAFETSRRKLGLGYVDLYLIHWPQPDRDLYVDSWKALENLYADGRVRSIGVSNFQPAHLRRILDETDVVPAVNQVELHPYLQQQPVREFDSEHGIATEAWGPLARGGELLRDPLIIEIAQRYGVSAAQVVVRWHLQLGTIVIPKSQTPARIRSNFDVFGFELTGEDMKAIEGLDRGTRTGPDPATVN